MKNTVKLAVLTILGISIFTVEIFSQCIQCKRSATKTSALTCQSSSSGGRECVSDGVVCSITGVCGGYGLTESVVECKEQGEEGLSVRIEEALLREIAAKHPRFAAALSSAAKSGFINEGAKVYFLPVEFAKEDFENWFEFKQPDQNNKSFNKFGEFAQKLNKPIEDLPPVTYSVSTQQLSDSTVIIRLDAENAFPSDPAYSTLEVTLVKSKESALKNKSWKTENWQLR